MILCFQGFKNKNMSEQSTSLTPEQRRHQAGRAWARFLGLDFLSDARHRRKLEDGTFYKDGNHDGGSGDGANLFVLVKDSEGMHAIKIGAGEFSPRTFLQDDESGYHSDAYRGHYRYASKIKPLTDRTEVFVVEQEDGYFGLRQGDKRSELFVNNPVGFMSKFARMSAQDGRVDFNQNHDWNSHWDEHNTPGFVTEHGGGFVEFGEDSFHPIYISDFEAALEESQAQFIGATALS